MVNLSWATPIYILGLYGMVRYLSKANPDKKLKLNWTPLEGIGITVFIYFFSQIVGGVLLYGVLTALGWNQAHISDWLNANAIGQFLFIVMVEAMTLGLLFNFLKRRAVKPKSIGLSGKPQLKDGGLAVLGFGAYFLIYAVVITTAKSLIPKLNIDQKQDLGFNHVAHWQLPLVFIGLVVLPPIVEEIVMRGFLYTGLKQKLPRIAAVVITSALFAMAHLQAGSGVALLWVAAIDTFILSLVLIELRERTNRLWSPMMLHALKNLIAFVSLFVLAKS